jgi:hypothetical protein
LVHNIEEQENENEAEDEYDLSDDVYEDSESEDGTMDRLTLIINKIREKLF